MEKTEKKRLLIYILIAYGVTYVIDRKSVV